MFSRVLFATDLSEASNLALDCVAGWKELGLSKVTIAHVHAIRYVAGAGGMEEQLRADHAPKLEPVCEQCGSRRLTRKFSAPSLGTGLPSYSDGRGGGDTSGGGGGRCG